MTRVSDLTGVAELLLIHSSPPEKRAGLQDHVRELVIDRVSVRLSFLVGKRCHGRKEPSRGSLPNKVGENLNHHGPFIARRVQPCNAFSPIQIQRLPIVAHCSPQTVHRCHRQLSPETHPSNE